MGSLPRRREVMNAVNSVGMDGTLLTCRQTYMQRLSTCFARNRMRLKGSCSGRSKREKEGIVVKNGLFHPTPFCQIFPQMCSSDIVGTIAKEMGSIGGLAWSEWVRTSGG
eukprot:1161075-Pelagomonas_calceolata.AAC.12